MFNHNEVDEREYLVEVQVKLRTAFERIDLRITDYYNEILETKRYIYENLAQFDAAEKAANRIAVYESVTFGEEAIKERERLQKLMMSPYFGRIDFSDTKGEAVLYIGIHGFTDDLAAHPTIFDWRAPISSMFYDFETGPAFYTAPEGVIKGMLQLKRQYRIRQGQMEYMIESSLNIDDEILQKELSRNSDNKMKSIVASIQREQNAIIRNEAAQVLIIQGAAGSGKTSIALHRVAFLLYRFKKTLTAKNIMIISPNKVFSNYISNVLPELGEENIAEMHIEDIAEDLLGRQYQYETFYMQVEKLLEAENAEAISRIRFKSTNQFVEQLQSYLEYADDNYFVPVGLELGDFHVSKKELLFEYHAHKGLPIKKRLRKIADNLIGRYKRKTSKKVDVATARQIRTLILKMYRFSKSISLYQEFYHYINQEAMFCLVGKKTLEFCDVYPLIYVKMYFEGGEQNYEMIQHLLVDEMQDYTPIEYAVLAKLFSCKMTILGDSHQSVNPYSSSTAEEIKPYFVGCEGMELLRSYRSTIEITCFTQKILENKKLIPIERHGKEPTVTICNTEHEQFHKIRNLICAFKQSEYVSLGILCKSQKQARLLFEHIHTISQGVHLLDFGSSEFKEGIVVTSVHMSKGLEFDQVIVPDASEDHFCTELDRSLLYIACTRAMHQLDLTCVGKKTKWTVVNDNSPVSLTGCDYSRS